MNLIDMRTLVRQDLHDEGYPNRWTDDELDHHIAHALKDFSEALPLGQKVALATTPDSREISISDLTGRIQVIAVEYPVLQFPLRYQRFALWGETLTMLGEEVPDGSDCYVFYGKLHTLDDSNSTIPAQFEDLVVTGALGYAACHMAAYAIDRVNNGGPGVPGDWSAWGKEKLTFFRIELKRLGKHNHVRVKQLYVPYNPSVSESTG